MLHKLEDLRTRLIDGGNEVIEEVVALYPMADRQQLRTLIRNAKKRKKPINRQNHSAYCFNI